MKEYEYIITFGFSDFIIETDVNSHLPMEDDLLIEIASIRILSSFPTKLTKEDLAPATKEVRRRGD